MKNILLLLAMGPLSLAQAQTQDDRGIFVNPATIDFTLDRAQSGNAEITIINKVDKKNQFNIYLSDWVRDTLGKHSYSAPGSQSRSCANWITVDKTFIEMEPNSVAKVSLRLTLPDSNYASNQMRWAMVFIESVQERGDITMTKKTMAGITTNYRVGVHVYQTPAIIKNKDLRMLSFSPRPNSNDSVYRVVCQNTGDIQIRCKPSLELQNLSDGKKYKVEMNEFPLFPEQKRYVDFVIPVTVPKGKYSAVAALDGGIDIPLEASQKTIEIK